MSDFLSKAKSHLKDFSKLPSPNHVLWKGFPLKQWEGRLSNKEWKRTKTVLVEEVVSETISLPFSSKNFSVLRVQDGRVQSLGASKVEGIEISKIDSDKASDFLSAPKPDSYKDLHEAISDEGLKIEVPAGLSVVKPLVICSSETGEGRWSSLNHKVKLGKGSSLKLILVHESERSLLSQLFKFEIEEGASLKVVDLGGIKKSQESYSRFEVRQLSLSQFEHVQLAHSSELGRTEIHVDLLGKEAEARVSGVHLLSDSEIFDSRVRIVHGAADSRSSQNFKCVVSDRAQSLFGGSIVIQKDAQRVDSSQSHKALLVSRGARATAYPELEVHADDVKAAHGSSTGQLDPEQVFYLKSRGLSLAESTHLLSEAFSNDVVLKTSDPELRQALKEAISRILPDFVQKMESKWLLN